MKGISVFTISFLVCLTISGQQINQSRNHYRNGDVQSRNHYRNGDVQEKNPSRDCLLDFF